MPYEIVTPAAADPVSAAEVKLQAAIDHSSLDSQIAIWIPAATLFVERALNRAIITQTRKEWFDGWPEDCFSLSGPPLASVTHIKYYNTSDVSATLASTEYDVDITSEPGVIRLKYAKTWPSTVLRPTKPIEIQYVCGYGAAGANVPAPIRQGILMLVASWVRNRESEITEAAAIQTLDSFRHLLAAYNKSYR